MWNPDPDPDPAETRSGSTRKDLEVIWAVTFIPTINESEVIQQKVDLFIFAQLLIFISGYLLHLEANHRLFDGWFTLVIMQIVDGSLSW